jgi:hypothetical protein
MSISVFAASSSTDHRVCPAVPGHDTIKNLLGIPRDVMLVATMAHFEGTLPHHSHLPMNQQLLRPSHAHKREYTFGIVISEYLGCRLQDPFLM